MRKCLMGLVVAVMMFGVGTAQAAKGIPYGQQTVSQQRATDQQAAIKNGTSVTSNATTFAVAYEPTAAPQTTGYYNTNYNVSTGVPVLSGYYQWSPGSNNFYAVGPVTVQEEKSGQSDTPAPPACTASEPGTITLLSPSDGMFMANTTVSLLWNSVASWGTACSGANNQYRLYLGTTNPPPLYATYDSGTLSTNYLGTKGSTYYWYVQAGNGQLTRNSATFSFTILNDQITGQVFYDRANNCGGSGWSTGGVAVSLDGGVGNAIAADGSFNLTASTLSSHTLEVSIPVGYVCSTVPGCNSCSRIRIASPSANNNFYLTDLLEPWWQAAGAGVYAGGLGGGVTVRSQLPTAETSLILPGTTGSVGALLRASGSVGVGNGRVSDEGYSTMARYRGKKMDYNFFAAQMGVDKL